MWQSVDHEIDVFMREAERRGACLESYPGRLHRALERRVESGELVSPLPRLYARAEAWRTLGQTERTLSMMRALGELHPDWVFCGTSAAVAHGLSVSNRLHEPLQVVTSSGARRYHGGRVMAAHARNEVSVTVSGVSATTLERTVFDCMRRHDFPEGLAIADSALRKGGLSGDALVAYVSSMGPRYRGFKQAKMTSSFADPRPENGMESIARATMYQLGYQMPDLQVPVHDPLSPGCVLRVDFMWVLPDGTVIIGELDGGEKVWNPELNGGSPLMALRRERRRESRITIDRPKIIRFSPEEVGDLYEFNRLLETFGVPRDHEPLVTIPDGPTHDLVPVEAYGLA